MRATSKHKHIQRAETAADVEAFLANGGQIQQIPTGQGKDNLTFRVFYLPRMWRERE